MLEVIALVVGIAIGVVVQRRLTRHASPPAATLVPEPEAPADTATPAPSPDLATRLASLREALDAAVESSAHARELAERAEMQGAAALLADPQVAPDVVRDYAFGASVPLACAAFAALGRRTDCQTAAAATLAKLPQMDFRVLYFALQYLASAPERPAVGAVVATPNPYWDVSPLAQTALAVLPQA
jgi:uncharacterized membrane-anchored protein YhcB (DUF1043 family)